MKKNNVLIPVLCLATLVALPGCFGKKKEAKKVVTIQKENKKTKELIEQDLS